MKPSELLSDESKWTKGCIARDHESNPSSISVGVCWCVIGAAVLCDIDEVERCRLDAAVTKLFPNRVFGYKAIAANFNDHPETTFTDIQAVLKEANL